MIIQENSLPDVAETLEIKKKQRQELIYLKTNHIESEVNETTLRGIKDAQENGAPSKLCAKVYIIILSYIMKYCERFVWNSMWKTQRQGCMYAWIQRSLSKISSWYYLKMTMKRVEICDERE